MLRSQQWSPPVGYEVLKVLIKVETDSCQDIYDGIPAMESDCVIGNDFDDGLHPLVVGRVQRAPFWKK